MITIDNLLSGFFGALVIWAISYTTSLYSEANRLNKIRRTVLAYLTEFGAKKIDRLLNDYEKVSKQISSPKDNSEEGGVDSMPMFTSELFKTFSHTDLFDSCYCEETYVILIEYYYMVDFLRANMPISLLNEYIGIVNNHLNQYEDIEERDSHKNCAFVKQKREHFLGEIKLKMATAESLKKKNQQLIEKLKGDDFNWILRYLGPSSIK